MSGRDQEQRNPPRVSVSWQEARARHERERGTELGGVMTRAQRARAAAAAATEGQAAAATLASHREEEPGEIMPPTETPEREPVQQNPVDDASGRPSSSRSRGDSAAEADVEIDATEDGGAPGTEGNLYSRSSAPARQSSRREEPSIRSIASYETQLRLLQEENRMLRASLPSERVRQLRDRVTEVTRQSDRIVVPETPSEELGDAEIAEGGATQSRRREPRVHFSHLQDERVSPHVSERHPQGERQLNVDTLEDLNQGQAQGPRSEVTEAQEEEDRDFSHAERVGRQAGRQVVSREDKSPREERGVPPSRPIPSFPRGDSDEEERGSSSHYDMISMLADAVTESYRRRKAKKRSSKNRKSKSERSWPGSSSRSERRSSRRGGPPSDPSESSSDSTSSSSSRSRTTSSDSQSESSVERSSHRSHKSSRRSRSRKSQSRSEPGPSSRSHKSKSRSEGHSRATSAKADRGGIFLREKGKAVPGLVPHTRTRREFRRLVDYRSYRLRDSRVRKEELRRLSKMPYYLNLTITEKFTGLDPIGIFQFLARFVQQAETVDLKEGEAFALLSTYLDSPAKEHYESAKRSPHSTTNSIFDWPTAVHWLLGEYATDRIIREAVDDFQRVRQRGNEGDSSFFSRFEQAHARCGSYMKDRDLVEMYVEAVDPRIRPHLRHKLGQDAYTSLLDLKQAAITAGEILDAEHKRDTPRVTGSRNKRRDNNSRRRTGASANYYEEPTTDHDDHEHDEDGECIEMQEIDENPLGEEEEEMEAMQMLGSKSSFRNRGSTIQQVPPVSRGTFPYENPGYELRQGVPRNRTLRPGAYFSATRGAERGRPRNFGTRQVPLICWKCFVRDEHFSTSCDFDVTQPNAFKLLCARSDNLTLEEKSRVPPQSYWMAKGILTEANRQYTGKVIFALDRLQPLLKENANEREQQQGIKPGKA